MEKRGILIFHAGALGDFVLTFFLARALRRIYPEHEITYVTHASKGRLAARFLGTGWSDIDVSGWHTLHSDVPALHVQARQLLDRAESAISFVGEAGDTFVENLRGLSRELRVSCVKPIPPEGWERHVTDFYVEQLTPDLPRQLVEEALGELWRDGLPAARAGGSRVLLHVGAGSVKKSWPVEYFLELADHLRSAGHEVAVMLGEAEMERMSERVVEQIRGTFEVVCPRDYLELAEELLNARLLVTNDNGPGHLAGVLGVEVLSLFGPTQAQVWRPVGPKARVIQETSMQMISTARVLEAILG